MHIAYLINQYPKISHTFIRNEILALQGRGVRVDRIALRGWDAEVTDPVDAAERDRTVYLLAGGSLGLAVALLRSFLGRPVKTLGALAAALRLSRRSDRSPVHHLAYLAEACLLREVTAASGASHVHAHFGTNAAEVAMLARQLGGPPYSFTVHGPEEFDKADQLKLREKVRGAAFVAAVSSFGRSQLYRHTDLADWSKIQVVHCGLGPEYLEADALAPAERPRLVCVGRLCEQKGQLILVEACAILASRNIAFDLLMIGDGEMRPDLEQAIAAAGLDDRIRITGWYGAEQIRDSYREAKGLVLPSFAEGLPVVIMEALALGRPVVSTYVAGIPELVRDGQEGFLVFAGSAGDLADAIERLLTLEPTAFGRMAQSGRERVAQRHSADREAEKLLRCFEPVVARESS